MDDWFIQPETRRLPLSNDQWVLVKRRINNGEFRAHLKRSSSIDADGKRRIDSIDHGFSLVLAYLLDWSLTTGDATIRGMALEDLAAALDNLDPVRFVEISDAVDAHVAAMNKERAQEKNAHPDGETKSAATSASPSDATGPSSTSVN